jgi:hypothetical protein
MPSPATSPRTVPAAELPARTGWARVAISSRNARILEIWSSGGDDTRARRAGVPQGVERTRDRDRVRQRGRGAGRAEGWVFPRLGAWCQASALPLQPARGGGGRPAGADANAGSRRTAVGCGGTGSVVALGRTPRPAMSCARCWPPMDGPLVDPAIASGAAAGAGAGMRVREPASEA